MKDSVEASLDEVIARYLDQLDHVVSPDPEAFVREWPKHREAFLDYLERSIGVDRSDSENAPSLRDPSNRSEEVDSRVVGQWRLGRLIGRGGMSRVYLAERLDDGSPAAVKVLDAVPEKNAAIQIRFRREAEAIQSLDHDHIVPLLDFGGDGRATYLALQLVDGCTLSDLARALGSEPLALAALEPATAAGDTTDLDESTGLEFEVASAGDQTQRLARECFARAQRHDDEFKDLAELIAVAADALQAAHDVGIIHRDIKPSNLMLDRKGHLWLTDFGLALLGDAHTAVTQTGHLVGTPHYMSPEQASGDQQRIDHRSDIYSLGATLYELVCRRRPHVGEPLHVLMQVSQGRFPHPSTLRAEIPAPLEAIILKAMSFSVTDRFSSAAAMAADLRRFAEGRATDARLPGPADHAMRWIVRNPRKSIAALLGIATIVLTAILIQYAASKRLSAINTRLTSSNQMLEYTNTIIEKTNWDLDQSRNRLRRYLYVADMAAAYRAYHQRDIDSVNQFLSQHAPGPDSAAADEADLRGFEWWLLSNLSRPPEVLKINGHSESATEAALVPGRPEVVSVGMDDWIRRWDLRTGERLGEFNAGGDVHAIAVSPDGAKMAWGSKIAWEINAVRVNQMSGGQPSVELTPHQYSVESVAFSPDGRWIAAASRYGDVILHDDQGVQRGRLAMGSRNESLAFSPDSRQLLAVDRQVVEDTDRQSLRSWSIPALEPKRTFELGLDPVVFALSDGGRWIVAADSDSWCVVRWSDSKPLVSQQDIRGRIRCVDISVNATHVTAGCDNGLLFLWNLTEGSGDGKAPRVPPPRVIATGDKAVTSVAFSNDGRIIATTGDGSVQVYTLADPNDRDLAVGESTRSVVRPAAGDDPMFVRRDDGTIVKLDLNRLEFQSIARVAPDDHYAMTATSDRQTLVADSPGELVILSATDGTVNHRIPTGLDEKSCQWLSFSDQDRRLLVLFNDRLRVYRTSDWNLVDEMPLGKEGGLQIVTSPDESIFLIVSRRSMQWCDAETLEVRHEYPVQWSDFRKAIYSDDGETIAVGHHDGTIELLDASDWQSVKLLRGHRAAIDDLIFVSENQTLASSDDDRTIRFWDVESGRELGTLDLSTLELGKFDASMMHFDKDLRRLFCMGPHRPIKVFSGRSDR